MSDISIRKFCEAYDKPESNVILVSTDEVGFRVQDYVLKTFSSVFRDMLYVASRQTPVQLDENSLELEKMLDLMHMTATEFKASFGESNWCRALRLYDVADKYGITRFHDVIEDIMAKSVKFTGALRAFFWACEHKSNTVAKAALKQFAHCMSPPDWPEKAGWHPVWCPAPWACGEEFPKMIGIDAYIQYVRACTAAIVEPSATLRTGTNAEAMLRSQVDWRVAATVFDFHYDPKMKRTKSLPSVA